VERQSGYYWGGRPVVFHHVGLMEQIHPWLIHESARLPSDAGETTGDRLERRDASIEVVSKIMPLMASLG
jgi:hypothetical protein